jgi:hypothetical protein
LRHSARALSLKIKAPSANPGTGGAAFSQEKVLACVVTGRRSLPPQPDTRYFAAVDMSGGSNDDSALAIFHLDGKVVVIDLVAKQIGGTPFNPRDAIRQFSVYLNNYRVSRVTGDAVAGMTYREDFRAFGVTYELCTTSASELYERLEPIINAGEIELLDHPVTTEQLVCLVWRGSRITHESNSHDDHANVVALAASVARGLTQQLGPNVLPIIVSGPRGCYGDIGNGVGEYSGGFYGGSMTNPAFDTSHWGRR